MRPDVLAVTPTWSDHPNPELPRARRYAAHLGIQHRVIEFNDVELAEGAMKITRLLEIPNRDFWAIVLLCLLERLAPEADVIIHGEGADSLLGNRSAQRVDSEMRWWRRFWFLPTPAKQALSRVLPNTNGKIGALREVLSEHPHRRLQRMGLLALDEWVRRRHRDLLGDGDPPEEVLAMAGDPGDDFVLRRLSSTIYSWMRVQMGEMVRIADLNGLRMLYPFLGERGLRLAARLPIDLKFTPDRQKKPIVKRAFGRHLPREWADEPKLGFPTPTRPWLRGPLAEWIADRTAPGTVGRAAFGTTVDRLTPDRHYDLIWTLATLEDYRRSMGLELPAWLET